MQTFVGMILGALLLVCGVYVYDSMQTSSVNKGDVAQTNRTIVNWDVASADFDALKVRAHDDWFRMSSKEACFPVDKDKAPSPRRRRFCMFGLP
jgi:hypothetical protein